MSNVLIVDDEETIAWGLARLAREEGHRSQTAATAEAAIELAQASAFDMVFLDVRLPGIDGLSAMPTLAASPGAPKVVVMTAFGDLKTAVASYEGGAFDYLIKPFGIEAAARAMRRALAPSAENRASAENQAGGDEPLIGATPAMQEVFKRIALVAPSDASVLITGESGTGKELVARAIHRHSARAGGPFVAVHLAALSPSVIESELFGHRRGAYTGADEAKRGLLEEAHGGTLFLDEIGEVPLDIQVKLLRAIEQREVLAVGSTDRRSADFRVVAATNRELRAEMAAGRFRGDFFYRLAMFEIELPPLRRRVDDIVLLAEHFAASSDLPRTRISPAALQVLKESAWPGNVRQLRNTVWAAALLARGGQIEVEHLPLCESPRGLEQILGGLQRAVEDWARHRLDQAGAEDNLYEAFLRAVEKPLLQVVLEKTGHNRAAAADLLGIHRATLRKKLL